VRLSPTAAILPTRNVKTADLSTNSSQSLGGTKLTGYFGCCAASQAARFWRIKAIVSSIVLTH
jgi:hypothetical protein